MSGKGLPRLLQSWRSTHFPKSAEEDQEIIVEAMASEKFDPYWPVAASAKYYAAWADQYLLLIVDGQSYPQFPIEAYLVYQFLQGNATQLSSNQAEGHDVAAAEGDHILVDKDLNITGIIDWQMARVIPQRETFGSSLVPADKLRSRGVYKSL